MTDRLIRHLTTAAVLLVAAIAAVISFIHIQHLAVTHGQDALSAALLPLSIDGLVAAMSGVMLRAARLPDVRTPWLARPMLFLGVGATLAANLAYGAAYGLVGALISGWPAVAFVGCVEVSVAMVRRTRPVTEPEPVPVVAEPVTMEPVTVTPVTSRKRKPRNANAERQRRYRAHGKGDHSLCLAGNCEAVTRDVMPELVAVNGNGKAHA